MKTSKLLPATPTPSSPANVPLFPPTLGASVDHHSNSMANSTPPTAQLSTAPSKPPV